MAKRRVGVITKEIGALVDPHESLAIDTLAANGFDILILKPRNTYKTRTPDIRMNGIEWEVKSPTSSEKTTIANIIHKAIKQSPYLIIDTLRTNLKDEAILRQLEQSAAKHRSIRKLIVITKLRQVVVLKGVL